MPPTPDDFGALGDERSARPVARTWKLMAVALLSTPVLGFFLPFFGVLASAAAAYLAVGRAGPVVWTGGGWPSGRRSAFLVGRWSARRRRSTAALRR